MACLVTNVNPSPHATAHVCYTMNNLMYHLAVCCLSLPCSSTMLHCRVLRLPWYIVEFCVYHVTLSSFVFTMGYCRVLRQPRYIVES